MGGVQTSCCGHGTARQGEARCRMARRGTAWHGVVQHITAHHGTSRHGKARCSTPRHGTARHGKQVPPQDRSHPPWGAEGSPSPVPTSHHPGEPCPSSQPLGADGAAPALGSTQRWGGRGEAPPQVPCCPQTSWCPQTLLVPLLSRHAPCGGTSHAPAAGGTRGAPRGPPLAHKRVTYKGLIQCLRDGGVSPTPSPPCAPTPDPVPGSWGGTGR